MPTNEELNGGFNLGDWEVLPARRMLKYGDEEVTPGPMAYDVLLALARRDGDVATTDALIDEVWEGRAFSDEPLQQKISELRRHFNDKRPYKYIGTVQRQGYRLLKPVELHEDVTRLESEDDVPDPRGIRLWQTVAGAIAAAFLAIIVYLWLSVTPPPFGSIAIMPLDNQTGDPANQYIVDSVKNALAQRLTELPEFTIKNVRGAAAGDPVQDAQRLKVESLLYGSVQLQDNNLRIIYEIVDGADGSTRQAGEQVGTLVNLWQVQESLANAVRDALAGSQTPQLVTLIAPDSAAYKEYLRGAYLLEHRFEEDNLEEAMRLFRQSIEHDEDYGPAYLGLATGYALLPDYRGAPLDESLSDAVRTIEKGVALDPTIADAAAAIHGFVHYQRKEWTEAEEDYKRAVNAQVVDTNAFSWYSQMLANVARMTESRDVALRAEVLDPDSTVINSRIAMVYTWLGNTSKAHEYWERANELHATGIIHDMAYALFLSRTGQLGQSQTMTRAAAVTLGTDTAWIDPVFRALVDPSYVDVALAETTQAYESGELIPHITLLVRTLLGDIPGAMEIANTLDRPGEEFSMEILYIDELAPLRAHPDFMPLLERLGVVDHWNDIGCRWEDDRLRCD